MEIKELNCSTCKFVEKVSDGVCGETWTCHKIKPFIYILNVPHKLEEWDKREVAVEYGFGCKMWQKKI